MLSQKAQSLLDFLSAKDQAEKINLNKSKINIRSSLGMFAFIYEKIRNFVDYQEEHLLLRRAITRILSRRIKTNSNPNYLANSLISELLMARYLESGFIPEDNIQKTEKILIKYLTLFSKIKKISSLKNESTLDFLLSLASREIEELLCPVNDDQLVNFALKALEEKIVWVDGGEEEQKRALIYVAILRSLSKDDDRTIYFKLWKLYFSNWQKADEKIINLVADKFEEADNLINRYLNDPRGEPILRILRKNIAPFEILRDLINQDYDKVKQFFASEQALMAAAFTAANIRYEKAIGNLRRSAINSFVYIFITKMLLAFAVEVPYEMYFSSKLNLIPLAINLVVPPGLMIVMSLSIESPKEENTRKIINEIASMVFGNNDLSQINIDLKNRKSKVLNSFFNIAYLFVFLFIIGLTIYVLRKLQFSIVSLGIFFFFISSVSFFAFRIRSSFKDLVVGEENSNFISIVFDFFMLPFIKLGRMISSKLRDVNLFIFIFDVFIEAPFKLILEVFEEWIKYLREKKEEALNIIVK